jgi:hypothetical protein
MHSPSVKNNDYAGEAPHKFTRPTADVGAILQADAP